MYDLIYGHHAQAILIVNIAWFINIYDIILALPTKTLKLFEWDFFDRTLYVATKHKKESFSDCCTKSMLCFITCFIDMFDH